jgi:peptide-methionine (S)-S-oxide reductase
MRPLGRPEGEFRRAQPRATPVKARRWLANVRTALWSVTFALALGLPVTAAWGATAKATFAGGCFWCVEADFDKVRGVLSTTSGYIGGTVANPRYEQVAAGTTGHAEAVEIVFDPAIVSYAQLLEYFWRTIDPTVKDRQFCDVGTPYRSAIFVHDDEQLAAAQASLAALQKSKPFKEPIVTAIERAGPFYVAEAYHQDYYRKNALRYQYYRASCGRDLRLQRLWGASR